MLVLGNSLGFPSVPMPLTSMTQSKPPSNSDNQNNESTPTDGKTQQPIVGEQAVGEQSSDEQADEELIDNDDYDYDLPTDRNERLKALDPYEEHVVFFLTWERDRDAEAEESARIDRWIDSLTPEELANDPF
jgi:hypothetical protein